MIEAIDTSSDDVIRYADLLFHELTQVPFLSKFVVFSRRRSPTSAQLRLFCVTDDKLEEKSLERYHQFSEIARSATTEVIKTTHLCRLVAAIHCTNKDVIFEKAGLV